MIFYEKNIRIYKIQGSSSEILIILNILTKLEGRKSHAKLISISIYKN